MDKTYERKLDSLSPVAIKLGQTQVCAPGHDTLDVIGCKICGERFAIGPNRTYGSRRHARECLGQLQALLEEDHKEGRSHRNSYELIE